MAKRKEFEDQILLPETLFDVILQNNKKKSDFFTVIPTTIQ